MAEPHDFSAQLAYSHSQADAPYWQEIYQQAFPDMIACLDLRHDGWHQRAGRDRAVILSTGRSVFIDEKVRRKVYPDIAVEVWSTYPKDGLEPYPARPGATPGWGAKPLDCDFLAYAFAPSRTCHLFPFLGIRAAFDKHRLMWRDKATCEEDGFGWAVAPNGRYNTISIAVPIRILQDCVNDALTICWGT
jgi:hypothetical protein